MRRKRTEVAEFNPDRVKPLPGQPRKRFAGIRELADSIEEVGQLAPGIVTLLEGDAKYDAQLVDGERRLRACKLAGKDFIAAIQPDAGAEEIFAASFAANFGKQDHDAIEISEGLSRLQRGGKTLVQLSKISGHSQGWVVNYLNLQKLHPDVQAMMVCEPDAETPRLTLSLAQLLVPVAPDEQVSYARQIVDKGLSMAAARRMILKKRAAAGDKHAYHNKKGRQKTIDAMKSILSRVADQLGVYLDMPKDQLNTIIDAVDNADKRRLIRSIEAVSDNLIDLAEKVENRIPRGPKAVARPA